MSTRLRTPWIDPVSVDPKYFVNRTADRRRLQQILGDLVDYDARKGLVVVGGDRGIGKSIFCRTVVADVVAAHPSRVLPVVLDARGADPDSLLKRFGQELGAVARAAAPSLKKDADWVQAWIDPLSEIALYSRVTRRVTSTQAREYGVTGELSGGVWGVLQGKFGSQWKEKRESGVGSELSLEVTREVLRVAIVTVLTELAKAVSVLVFFDDLDQASGMENPESAKDTIQLMVDLAPSIALIHLRSEVKFPDIRREHSEHVELGPLEPRELNQILRKRLEGALDADRRLAERHGGWEPFERLMGATGNPYVLLRWAVALVRAHDAWPPEPGWMAPDQLRRLAVQASGGPPIDDQELEHLGQVLDRLQKSAHIQERELLEGHRALDTAPARVTLDQPEIDRLKRLELLVQVDRHDGSLGLRLDPLLDLIRPSTAARLRAAG